MLEMLQIYWPSLLTVYVACLIALISPGPNFVAVSSRAIEHRKSGLALAFGISCGTIIWILFVITGMTAILRTFEQATRFIQLIGGTYLCWLGAKSLHSIFYEANFEIKQEKATSLPFSQAIKTGVLLQLTNPKTAFFWVALTSLVVQPATPIMIIIVLALGCLAIEIMWHVFLAMAFSSGPVRNAYLNYKPIISMIFGILFIGFGLRILYSVLT